VDENKPADIADRIMEDLHRDTMSVGRNAISPIVHAPRLGDGRFAAELLPELCALVAKRQRPPVVAIAERELGDGILERARRVYSIRKALDRLGFKQPLHILGTGNPLSIMILALAGGDIFDGLEWCRTVVDGMTMRLHHFHQFDLFLDQRKMIENELLREYLDTQDELLTAKAKAVLHNLYFFQKFASELREAYEHDNFEGLFDRYLPGEYMRIVRRITAEN
jgi:queuine/archaeosine tRNA-ribosyltransferase